VAVLLKDERSNPDSWQAAAAILNKMYDYNCFYYLSISIFDIACNY